MALNLQLSTTVRNARLDTIETTIGTAAMLRIWTGTQPANCATADSGTKLLEIALPSDYMANAASGAKAIAGGPWTSTGLAAGTAGYFRLYNTAGTTCHIQGTVGTSGTDMTIDNTSIASGQTVNINSFTLTDANA